MQRQPGYVPPQPIAATLRLVVATVLLFVLIFAAAIGAILYWEARYPCGYIGRQSPSGECMGRE